MRAALAAGASAIAAGMLAAADVESIDPAALSAGSLSTLDASAGAYSMPVAMLDKEQLAIFAAGREQFNEAWVLAPDPSGVWGLGPTFNEDRCAHCHEHNGRARAPGEREPAARGMLVRLSVTGAAAHGGPKPHPAYGDQLQNRGIQGRVPAEGQAVFTYETKEVALAGGEVVRLRAPKVQFTELQFGEIGPEVMTSPRVAPAMVGLGLLEAVPEQTILELAKLLQDTDDPVSIELSGSQARFRFDGILLASKLVDGKFPDYQKVIPAGHRKQFLLDRQTLQQSLQRAAILSNEKFRGVRWVLTENSLRIISSNTEQEESEEELEIQYSGEPLDIGFNVSYLLDVLGSVPGSRVDCSLGDANSSMLLTLPDNPYFQYVVMPMRI